MKPVLYRFLLSGLVFMAGLAFWVSCAQVGSPSGGPVDSLPPQVLRTVPENYTANFQEDEILIVFDEYYVLKNRQNAVKISPPLSKKPKVLEKGKQLIIRIEDTLRKDRTYTFDFGENIQDLNEGNPLGDYGFVVATGHALDSLRISGRVLQATDWAPQGDIAVMAYLQHADPLPINELPDYYALTDKEGNFSLKNIKAGTYKLFALKDANRNLLFDNPSEAIAFTDSLFTPRAKRETRYDTLRVAQDSLTGDSVVRRAHTAFYPDDVHLLLFQENHERQYLKRVHRPHNGQMMLEFNRTLTEVDVRPLDFPDTTDWAWPGKTPPQDTISFWLKDTSWVWADSLRFEVSFPATDSTGAAITQHDTVDWAFAVPPSARDSLFLPRLRLEALFGQTLKPSAYPRIRLSAPLGSIDTSLLKLYIRKDTVWEAAPYQTRAVDTLMRRLEFAHPREGANACRLVADSAAIRDYYGAVNDSIAWQYSYAPAADFGHISVWLHGQPGQGRFQVLDAGGGETPVLERYISLPDSVQLPYQKPGKYIFKFLLDPNENRVHDTGNYLDGRQPEPVFYYPKTITVKAGWSAKMDWLLEAGPFTKPQPEKGEEQF